MAGKTDENIEALDVLTYDGVRMRLGASSAADVQNAVAQGGRRGEIFSGLQAIRDRYGELVRQKYPNIPRRVSGYNLNYLLPENGFHLARALVGSEGTCATVLEATCRLVESPPERVLLVIGCRDVFECADLVPEVLSYGPIGLEGMDDLLINYTRKKQINSEGLALLPPGGGWLLAEFGARALSEAESQAQKAMLALGRNSSRSFRLLSDRKIARKAWEVRESALGAVSNVPGEPPSWEGWEDSAVAPERLGQYLRALLKLTNAYSYRCVMYGHFGDGCVHNRMDFDLQTVEGIKIFRRFMEEAADLVISFGGTLSGEHGDGQARAELLPRMFGPEIIGAFEQFKALWDPDGMMNPGKLVRPNPLDQDLRLGPDYKPWAPSTHFKFPHDEGSLTRATLRCVGVGKCRQYEGGVMCPSFRVTREEKHSTRGRAHLLWEIMRGDTVRGRWRDPEVKSSLDLCLSCKGCKSDCPVAVDVATYKAEFLSHYYEGRLHPPSHYAFARIDRWARLASAAPALANFLTQMPGLSDLARFAAGVARQRRLPLIAKQTFQRWFRQNRLGRTEGSRAPVLLWPDTFNNYFHPETAIAAVDVLEASGFQVRVPCESVCCGRPLYDFGMLAQAKDYLLRTLKTLERELTADLPIVVLEPSCASVFRDEMLNLLPDDPRAQKLAKQVLTLGEFLELRVKDVTWPQLPRHALLHGHCHQKSVLNMDSEESVLRRMGVDFRAPAAGCCGMAGAFGFEREKYATSIAIGELELLPAVRNAPADSLIIADGFSCREQIHQCTGRTTLHLAEVMRLAVGKK
jgi:Fe-S oxidoreductase/FAD/FMN-containing dehydrogenase